MSCDTAYLMFTPDPRVYPKTSNSTDNPLWIKFGDTKDSDNSRVSVYNTYNPSFYVLTIRVTAEKENKEGLGTFLETSLLDKNQGYENVKVEQNDGKTKKTEWYKVKSGRYESVMGLFGQIHNGHFPNVKEASFGTKGEGDITVRGKLVEFYDKNDDRKSVAQKFKEYLE